MKNLPRINVQNLNELNNKFRKELNSLRSLLYKEENNHLIPVEEDFFRSFIKSQETMIINEYMRQPYFEESNISFFQNFMKKNYTFSEQPRTKKLTDFNSLFSIMEPFLYKIDSFEFEKIRLTKSIYVEFLSSEASEFKKFLKELGVEDTIVFSLYNYLQKNKNRIKKFLAEDDL